MDWECCWDRERIEPGECPNIEEGEEQLLLSYKDRILEKCWECDRLKNDLKSLAESGNPFSGLIKILYEDYQRKRAHIHSLDSFLNTKALEVRFLHELNAVLQSSVDLDEVLSVALTAITSGKGFGMNRAFLMLSDKERHFLRGHLAIGPRSAEEAGHTWNELAAGDLDLKNLSHYFRQNKLSSELDKFHDILERLVVSLDNIHHIVVRSLEEKKPILVENAFNNPDIDPEFANILGVDSFLVLPLISRNRRVGIIITDNLITGKPITEEDMRSIETFTFPVAFAIERASLYERLHEEVEKLQDANKRLNEQHEQLVRMEKMALVGRITSSVAHTIRNPLMIIGGFARSILKSTPKDDPKRSFIDSIVNEASQLESVLEEILTYSDSLYPAMDFWNVNQLVETSIRDVQDKALKQNFSFFFHLGSDLPNVYIDYKQTSICIRNILYGTIDSLENGRLDIYTRKSGDRVEIQINDHGRSLSEDELESMLTPFAETHETGSGLNLALCRNMLEKQNIPLLVVAPPEGGVTYSIKLPTQKEET